MNEIWVVAAGLGFLLGMRHAMDPDHLIAVSTIVSRSRRLGVSWLIGAAWGLGHTLTVFAVGAAIIALKVAIPARVGLSMEFAVGLVLVTLGLLNLRGVRAWPFGRSPGHAHEHEHQGGHGHHLPFTEAARSAHVHEHEHPKALGWLEKAAEEAGSAQLARAFGAGLVHGLAGSAAVALLVLASIPTVRGGIVYLLVFGAGTLVGMSALSAVMEASLLWLSSRFRVEGFIRSGTGLLSLCFGLYIVYQTGFVDGLFLKTAVWNPH